MTLTIDGTDIADYGFRFMGYPDIHGLPPLKSILENWNSATELNKHQEYDFDLRLTGDFNTTAEMVTAISDLDTLLRATVVHNLSVPELTFYPSAVVKNGFKTRIYGHGYTFVELTIRFTLTA